MFCAKNPPKKAGFADKKSQQIVRLFLWKWLVERMQFYPIQPSFCYSPPLTHPPRHLYLKCILCTVMAVAVRWPPHFFVHPLAPFSSTIFPISTEVAPPPLAAH